MAEITCSKCGHKFTPPSKTHLHVGNINEVLFTRISKKVPFSSIRVFYVCSPFLSQLSLGQSTLENIGRKKRLVVITRPKHDPTVDARHGKQFEFLQQQCKADMNTITNLHAKMYVLEAGNSSFALVGSMNLTNPKSIEAAILTTDSRLYDEHKETFLYELKAKSKHIP